MEVEIVLAFCAAAFLLALMPGPDNIYVLSLSISNGSRQGIGLTTGLVSGVVVHTLLAATGLSIVLYSSDLVFSLVKYAGAIYLIYLAYGASQDRVNTLTALETENLGIGKLYRQGVLMNVLNPKVSLFFIALLPQFISSPGWNPMIQMSILGLIFMLIAFLTFSSIALVAGRLLQLVENDKFWIITKWVKVGVLVILALTLALSSK